MSQHDQPSDDELAVVELRNMTAEQIGISGEVDVEAREVRFEDLDLDEVSEVTSFVATYVSGASAECGHGTPLDENVAARLDCEIEITEGYSVTVSEIEWMG